jgi:diguanylate cyclase (GGDEF)-like protein/PAS domain S-box-containing protein
VSVVPPELRIVDPVEDEQHRLAFRNAPIGIAVVALDGRFVRVNPALCRITGYTAEELVALRFQDITHPDDLDDDVEQAGRLLSGESDAYQMEKRYRRCDGSVAWVRLSGSVARSDSGEARYFIAHVEDISDSVAARALADHHGLHDPLTDLPNRQYLLQRLQEALGSAGRHGKEVALLLCDLVRFQEVNRRFGHAAGDVVLVEVARRITSAVRVGSTVARLGADEFAVVQEHVTDRAEVFRTIERIRSAVEAPVRIAGQQVEISASIGAAFAAAGGNAQALDRLVDATTRDLARDRRRGRDRAAGVIPVTPPGRPLRLVVVDDADVVRAGLTAIAEQDEDLSVVAAVPSVRDAKVVVGSTGPDVVLVAAVLQDGNGFSLCRELCETLPALRCIVLSVYVDQEAVARAEQAGVSAYLSKEVAAPVLVEAVRQVAKTGCTDLPEDHLNRRPEFPAERRLAVLSPRERQMAYLVGDGLTNRQVAGTLGWSEKTAKNYMTRILHKLDVGNRADVRDLVQQARRERERSPTPPLPRQHLSEPIGPGGVSP